MARPGVLASRPARAWIALLCIGLMLLAVNIIAGRFANVRLDLTREGLYTLSRGTRQTLAHIDEPVTLRFYYSTRLGDSAPAYGVYAQRVRELLDEYVAAAHGKLRLEIYNPQPFSDVEDRAVAFGLQPLPLAEPGAQGVFWLAGRNPIWRMANCGSKSTTRSPSPMSRTVPSRSACNPCRSTSRASRCSLASRAPTPPTISRSSPSSRPSASASSNMI